MYSVQYIVTKQKTKYLQVCLSFSAAFGQIFLLHLPFSHGF